MHLKKLPNFPKFTVRNALLAEWRNYKVNTDGEEDSDWVWAEALKLFFFRLNQTCRNKLVRLALQDAYAAVYFIFEGGIPEGLLTVCQIGILLNQIFGEKFSLRILLFG